MVYLVIATAAILFYEVFARSGALADVRNLSGAVRTATATIRDPSISDMEKELASRRGAVDILKHLALTLIKIVAAIALSTLALWILCRLADIPFEKAVSHSASLLVIAGLVPLMLIYGRLRHVFRH